tara:strand:+ start:629 stop:1792 length:1164 start_codon:yes stop_codon:yes gene_type:complete
MPNIVLKILGFLTLILIVFYVYYKLKYKFWSRQPVFHIHNLKYWLFPPGFIQKEIPKKDKFYDYAIKTKEFSEVPEDELLLFTSFIKAHYMPKKYEKYNPSKDNVLDYFKHHNDKSYITLKYEMSDITKNSKTLISSITSRPLECIIDGNKINLNYVDFLCVKKDKRKQGIAPKSIYTHYVDIRGRDKNIAFLFKREGVGTLIVPLTTYYNYMFDMTYWDLSDANFSNIDLNLDMEEINTSNFSLFTDLLLEIKPHFECIIMPNLQNLKYLCEKKLIYIYVLMINKKPNSFYLFKNNHTTYDGDKSIDLMASFCNTSKEIFTLGFFNALTVIKPNIKYLFLENISNNNYILKNILKRYSPKLKTPASYYFYNFGYIPKHSTKIMCIN